VIGKDRDVGYGFLRVTPEQPWNASHLAQPLSAAWLALFFQWGVAMHDLRIDETLAGRQPLRALLRRGRPFARKALGQLAKDYVLFPLLALANAPRVVAGNLAANGLRNVWTFTVIFCGHFPEGVSMYREEATAAERRGAWYVRQLNGSANLEGSRTFHVLTGHLSHQIEHHLFPDLPASRYPELAPRVREICERYGQTYNSGPLGRQVGSVVRRLVRNALPSTRREAA
jgi:linoleoyl-CoA desaturase